MAKARFVKDKSPVCTAKRAAELCEEFLTADAERLEYGRLAESLKKRQTEIVKSLGRFVRDGGKCHREVSRFLLEFVEADGFFSYKDNLIAEIGVDEFNRRQGEVPKVPRLEITELRPARKSATRSATTRTKPRPGSQKSAA